MGPKKETVQEKKRAQAHYARFHWSNSCSKDLHTRDRGNSVHNRKYSWDLWLHNSVFQTGHSGGEWERKPTVVEHSTISTRPKLDASPSARHCREPDLWTKKQTKACYSITMEHSMGIQDSSTKCLLYASWPKWNTNHSHTLPHLAMKLE